MPDQETPTPPHRPRHPHAVTAASHARTAPTSDTAADTAAPAPAGLYLHLPFCFHKCHYCDFFSVVEPDGTDQQSAFTDALIAELRRAASTWDLRPDTVFVGGGTPTLLQPALWTRLLDALAELHTLDRVAEFTVEANPETVTVDLMRTLAAGGVNRVSIGAQSFDRASLKALQRWHDPDNVPRAIDACRAAGIDNLSLDLIFAIPGQTLDMLDRDLDRVLALQPTHLSTYGLTYEPNTALSARLRVGQVTAVPEETEAAMYDRVMQRLDDAGYEQYEISNWAQRDPARDFRCAHNLHYWHNADWLGLGPAAASHVHGRRWRNEPNLPRYLAGSPTPPITDDETLPPKRRLGERLMLGLRLNRGVSRAWLESQMPPNDPRWALIDETAALGLLETTDGHLRLTRRGRFVADTVIARLL